MNTRYCERRWLDTPGRRCRCRGRRRREAPTTAGAAATAARRTTRQTLKFVLRAITKQNQNTQKKMPTTQPNPQYSAKNNVSIHMIEAFMPPPFIITGLNHITNKWILLLFWTINVQLLNFLSKIPPVIDTNFRNFRKILKFAMEYCCKIHNFTKS